MSRPHLLVFALVTVLSGEWTAFEAGDNASSAKKPFSISVETTYITEPVDKDGFIDYAAGLND